MDIETFPSKTGCKMLLKSSSCLCGSCVEIILVNIDSLDGPTF